jgi:alanine-synthesizing transaminase
VFSRRLDWHTPDNALAALERERRAAGAPLVDLTLSNPTAVGLTSRAAALAAALARPGVAAYRPAPLGPLPARKAIAAEYARLGAEVPAERIALTASSSESYALLFKLLADPGDSVLVPQPSYPLFDYLARLEGLATRAYRLASTTPPARSSGAVTCSGCRSWRRARACRSSSTRCSPTTPSPRRPTP